MIHTNLIKVAVFFYVSGEYLNCLDVFSHLCFIKGVKGEEFIDEIKLFFISTQPCHDDLN